MSYIVKNEQNRPVIVKGQNVTASDNFETELKDFSDKSRSFTAVISRETADRMGDEILVSGWQLKNYRKNPVVQPFHDYRALPVGRSIEEWVKGNRLMGRPQFASYPEAEKIYSLYRDKYLKGFSVGFVALKSEPIEQEKEKMFSQATRFLKHELLEYSVVPIPAHQDALAEIKTLVKNGDLYIPAKYLQEEETKEVETYDEYIHVVVDDIDKFISLYIAPVIFSDEAKETPICWVVFGLKEGEDEFLLFNQRFIFSVSKFNEEAAMKWAKDNSLKVDLSMTEDGDGLLTIDKSSTRIKPETYVPEKYESRSPVLVDEFPTCDPTVFSDCEERKDTEEDKGEAFDESVALEEEAEKRRSTATEASLEMTVSPEQQQKEVIERLGCIQNQLEGFGAHLELLYERVEELEKDITQEPEPGKTAVRVIKSEEKVQDEPMKTKVRVVDDSGKPEKTQTPKQKTFKMSESDLRKAVNGELDKVLGRLPDKTDEGDE